MVLSILYRYICSRKHYHSGLGDCVQRMFKEEGPKSFLIGVKARVGWIAPFTAIQLGLNDVLRRKIEEFKK
jgi:hypothetical protein